MSLSTYCKLVVNECKRQLGFLGALAHTYCYFDVGNLTCLHDKSVDSNIVLRHFELQDDCEAEA